MRLRRSRFAKPCAVKVLSVDPSLTSTGWAVRGDHGEPITGNIDTGNLRGPWRLHYAMTQLCALLDAHKPDVVAYEGYAMGRVGKFAKGMQGSFDMGELGGVYKREIWVRGIDLVVVPPSTLKKFLGVSKGATGLTAVQKKARVVKAIANLFGYDVPQHDQADALGLLFIGEMYSGLQIKSNYPLKCTHADLQQACERVRGKLQSISIPGHTLNR